MKSPEPQESDLQHNKEHTQDQDFGSNDPSDRINSTCHPAEETMANITSDNMTSNESPDLSFCILWSPLHPITTLLPFIGHLGISDSLGRAHDFRGPYYVGTDASTPLPKMAFGPPTRYLKMDIGELPGGADRWDEAIHEANEIYKQRMHNICCDNCHSHVARALNILEHQGRHDWNMVKLCFLVFFKGSFVNYKWAILLQFGPFLVLVLIYLVAWSFSRGPL